MRTATLFLALAVLLPHLLVAQFSGGSPYSSFGIGTPNLLGWGPSRSMAGVSAAFRSDDFFSPGNPASYTGIAPPANVLFTTGLNVDLNQLATYNDTDVQRDGGLTHLALWVRPLESYAFTLGLEPYTTVKYNILSDPDREVLGNGYRSLSTGSGGLTRLFWGHGLQLPLGLSVGANVGVIFGNITKEEELFNADPGAGFRVSSSNHLTGFSHDYGVQWVTEHGESRWVAGATYRGRVTFNNAVDVSLTALSDTVTVEGDYDDEDYAAPERIALGLAFHRPRWSVTTEFGYEGWGATDNDDNVSYQDARYLSVGGEYNLTPTRDLRFRRGTVIRAGLSLREGNMAFNGRRVNEWVATTGISLPYQRGRNHFDLSYSFHRKGTTAGRLIEENRHSVGIGIALRDVWFQKRLYN